MTIPYTIAVTARLARVTPQPSITSADPFRPMLMPIVLTHDNKNSHSERAQMKLPENRVILCWTLIIVTAASAINLIIVTANYDLANLSLNKLDFTVSKVTFQNPLSNASILVGVTANNTVNFDGLKATHVIVSIYFFADGSTLFQDKPLAGYSFVDKPLAAQGFTPLSVIILLTPSNATNLQEFKNQNSGNVTANTTVTVDVSSIVSSLYNEIQLRTGIGTQYQQPQNVSLT